MPKRQMRNERFPQNYALGGRLRSVVCRKIVETHPWKNCEVKKYYSEGATRGVGCEKCWANFAGGL